MPRVKSWRDLSSEPAHWVWEVRRSPEQGVVGASGLGVSRIFTGGVCVCEGVSKCVTEYV